MKEILYSRIEGSGEPLLILHGFLGMSDNWKTLSGRYAEAGFEVHALDLRNHGRSFHSDEFNYEALTNDIVVYCDHHQLGKINIIGHSMGGKVAMFFAVRHPQRVGKLIVADIGPKYYPPHHDDILKALNAVDFSTMTERSSVEDAIRPYVPEFSTRQFLMKSVHRSGNGLEFRFNLDAFNRNVESIGQALSQGDVFEGQALFLRGELSRYIQDEDMTLIRHHFPNSEVKTISKAGHWLHAENPDEFFEVSISFLK